MEWINPYVITRYDEYIIDLCKMIIDSLFHTSGLFG